MFSAFVSFTTVFSLFAGALAPVSTAAAVVNPDDVEAGDLIKKEGGSAVYYITSNLGRRFFPREECFISWFGRDGFKNVKTLAKSVDLDELFPPENPAMVQCRPGSWLFKTEASNRVYVMGLNNVRYHVKDEATAAALFGPYWNKHILVFRDDLVSATTLGGSVDKPFDGYVFKKGGKTYQMKNAQVSEVVGDLPSFMTSEVFELSDSLFNALAKSNQTVTVASLTANPAQSSANGPTVPSVAGTLRVSLASDTPAGGYAVKSAARVPFTKIRFENPSSSDVTVTSFKVVRGGSPAVNGDFNTINVVDENGNLLNDAGKSLNSDNMVTFTEDVVVPKNGSRTITLVGDMSSSLTGGNVPTLGLYSLESTAASVEGVSLPVYGNPVTTNANVTLGTVTLAESTTIGSQTKQVGSQNVELASLKISVSSEDFQIGRIVLNNSGTSADADVTNLKLKYNNNVIATGMLKDKYLTFDLSSCTEDCKLLKGNDKTFSVTGDIVGGSGRTINLDVQKAVHVLAKDLKNNYYVTPTNNASSMTNTVTVSQGKLDVSKTNDVAAGDIPENASNIALGSWNFKVTGEPIDVRTLVFRLATTGTVTPAGFDSLTLYDKSGKALIGGVDASTYSTGVGYATTTDTITLPVGDNILTLRAKIDSTPVDGDTVVASLDMSNTANFDARGQNTNDTITLGTYATPNSRVSANTMTIRTSQLRVTTLSTPPATTVAPGSSDLVVAKVQFDASGSSEDVKVTQVKVNDNTGATAKTIDIQNIRLFVDKDGDSFNGAGTDVALGETVSGSDSTAGNDEEFTFNLSGSDQFVVKAGKKVVVTVKVNIAGSGTTGSHTFYVSGADDVSATGVTSGSTVSEVIDSASGQAMTIGSAGGQVQVSIDPSSPTSKLYAAGSTGVTLGVFNFLATSTEDVELDYVYLTQRTTAAASSSYNDYSRLYFVNEAGTVVGEVVPTSTKPLMDFASKAVVIPMGDTDGVNLTLKADLSNIASNQNVTVGGHYLGFNIAAAADVVAKGALTGNGANEYFGTATPNGVTHYMYKAVPTVNILDLPTTVLSGSADLYKFTVSCSQADCGLYKFTFDISTSSVTMTQLELYDITSSAEVLLYSSSTIAHAGTGVIADVYLNRDTPTELNVHGTNAKEVVVSKNQPRTFVLRGTFSGLTTNSSVTTRMAGDAALPGETAAMTTLMAQASTIATSLHNDFIWSDRNLGSHATTTADWTNGFLVNGLAQTTSSAKVLSR